MSKRIEVRWPWVIAAAFVWPVLHVVVFTMRFGEIPVAEALSDLLLFLPTGFAAALALRILLRRAEPGFRSWMIILGVSAALPFAFLGNLMGGLLGPVGVTIFGVAPILIGAGAGWVVGRLRATDSDL